MLSQPFASEDYQPQLHPPIAERVEDVALPCLRAAGNTAIRREAKQLTRAEEINTQL